MYFIYYWYLIQAFYTKQVANANSRTKKYLMLKVNYCTNKVFCICFRSGMSGSEAAGLANLSGAALATPGKSNHFKSANQCLCLSLRLTIVCVLLAAFYHYVYTLLMIRCMVWAFSRRPWVCESAVRTGTRDLDDSFKIVLKGDGADADRPLPHARTLSFFLPGFISIHVVFVRGECFFGQFIWHVKFYGPLLVIFWPLLMCWTEPAKIFATLWLGWQKRGETAMEWEIGCCIGFQTSQLASANNYKYAAQ